MHLHHRERTRRTRVVVGAAEPAHQLVARVYRGHREQHHEDGADVHEITAPPLALGRLARGDPRSAPARPAARGPFVRSSPTGRLLRAGGRRLLTGGLFARGSLGGGLRADRLRRVVEILVRSAASTAPHRRFGGGQLLVGVIRLGVVPLAVVVTAVALGVLSRSGIPRRPLVDIALVGVWVAVGGFGITVAAVIGLDTGVGAGAVLGIAGLVLVAVPRDHAGVVEVVPVVVGRGRVARSAGGPGLVPAPGARLLTRGDPAHPTAAGGPHLATARRGQLTAARGAQILPRGRNLAVAGGRGVGLAPILIRTAVAAFLGTLPKPFLRPEPAVIHPPTPPASPADLNTALRSSNHPCRIDTAAAWSIICRWPRARTPLSRNARAAVTVVKRSSESRIGTSGHSTCNWLANLMASAADVPPSPRSVRGRPTITSTASYSRTMWAIRAISAAGARFPPERAPPLARCTVSTGVARMPSGSDEATPMRTVPTSMPIRLPRPGSVAGSGRSGLGLSIRRRARPPRARTAARPAAIPDGSEPARPGPSPACRRRARAAARAEARRPDPRHLKPRSCAALVTATTNGTLGPSALPSSTTTAGSLPKRPRISLDQACADRPRPRPPARPRRPAGLATRWASSTNFPACDSTALDLGALELLLGDLQPLDAATRPAGHLVRGHLQRGGDTGQQRPLLGQIPVRSSPTNASTRRTPDPTDDSPCTVIGPIWRNARRACRRTAPSRTARRSRRRAPLAVVLAEQRHRAHLLRARQVECTHVFTGRSAPTASVGDASMSRLLGSDSWPYQLKSSRR